ncbi:MAG: sulfur oxidation c-type cytochrome SoxA [Gammaproteobacteria bacterium]|nr:sulfur oxidation c-type cytochrome SoxA [Gammaproteobacteria bacterium]
MRRTLTLLFCAGWLALSAPLATATTPQEDLQAFRQYFQDRYPATPFDDFQNGIYSIDANRRAEWEAMEEFPPYEIGLEIGQQEFEKPFANGQTYASCFKNGGINIRQHYPYFDAATGDIKTLEGEINECRVKNGEEKLRFGRGKLAAIAAYMASTSNGSRLNVVIPDDPRALEWYNRGKKHYFAKRGQLNMSCADCHYYYAGHNVRADLLHPALGDLSHFPVYRKKWEARGSGALAGFGTTHRRFNGCNEQVRAKGYGAQSDEYKALEYYLTFMSNGIPINAPGVRQ